MSGYVRYHWMKECVETSNIKFWMKVNSTYSNSYILVDEEMTIIQRMDMYDTIGWKNVWKLPTTKFGWRWILQIPIHIFWLMKESQSSNGWICTISLDEMGFIICPIQLLNGKLKNAKWQSSKSHNLIQLDEMWFQLFKVLYKILRLKNWKWQSSNG